MGKLTIQSVLNPKKREAILDAAEQAFATRGFKKTSIDEVARQAGVGKGTVYMACESKADLLYQCVVRDLHAWAAQINRFVDPRKPASEILATMARTGVVYLAEHPLVRELFSGVHQGTLPDWTDRFEDLRTMGRTTVAQVLQMGIRQGEFRSDLDVEETAALIQDITHSGYILYGDLWAKDVSLAEGRIGAFTALLLDGLRPR